MRRAWWVIGGWLVGAFLIIGPLPSLSAITSGDQGSFLPGKDAAPVPPPVPVEST